MTQILTRQDINALFSQAHPHQPKGIDVDHEIEFIWPAGSGARSQSHCSVAPWVANMV